MEETPKSTEELHAHVAVEATAMVSGDDNGDVNNKRQARDERAQEQVVVPTSGEDASEPEHEAAPTSGDSADAELREVEERFQLAEKLHAAVAQGDVVATQGLLEQGAALNIENEHGKFPIHVAAQRRDHQVVEFLKKHGASIDDRDTSGKTQLFCDAESGSHEAVEFLLEHGAVVGAKDLEDKTALFAAAGNGHLDVVRLLAEKGANVNETDQHLRTPLLVAAKQGHLEIVQYLVDGCGAVVNVTQKIGRTPLMFAASNGHLDVVTYLLNRSPASISTEDQNKWTPLHVAAGNGRTEIVELLIAKDAAVNVKGPDGATPLYLAAQRGNTDIVTMLLEKGVDVNLTQNQGKMPLLAAAENGFADVVKLLINAGASVHEKDESGNSGLLAAASKGNIEIVKMLVTREASVNEKDADARTPLMAAAKSGRLEIVRLLLDNGADIDDKQKFGRTPLMLAISNRHREVVKLLLDRGASVEAKDDKGWSPLHIAAGSNQPYILSMLVEKGAAIADCTLDGTTPLDLAVQKGFGDVIRQLLERGQSTVYKKPDYDGLLISAARSGHITILKFLRDRGASLHARASDGETVLLSTARWGFRGYFKLLAKSSALDNSELPEGETSLLSGTLETMRELCEGVSESKAMYDRVVARLMDVCSALQSPSDLRRDEKAIMTFADIVYRFCRQLLRCRSKTTISRFMANYTNNSSLRDLHEEIDNNFMDKLTTGNVTTDVHTGWQTAWSEGQEKQRVKFQETLSNDKTLQDEISTEEDKIDVVTHLKFMLENFGWQNANDQNTTRSVIDRLVSGDGSAFHVPTWFVSRYNVEFEDWHAVGESRFVVGKWLKSTVMISKCDLGIAQFEQIATTWKKLGHPNVLDLFGACHVGAPRFFVCDASSKGTLRAYLQSRNDGATVLKKLHESAQGMLFLRERGIIHGDLTTNKILVGEDGKAKIGGFELGIVGEQKSRDLVSNYTRDAINWTSAEVQRGEPPSLASDIYALGVCILDILTMNDPWRVRFGSSLRHYLLRNDVSPPPGIVNSRHWSLVKEMCASNPNQRVNIAYVVSTLGKFIEEATVEQHAQQIKLPTANLETLNSAARNADEADKELQIDLNSWLIHEFNTTIGGQLQLLKVKCSKLPELQLMAMHIHSRLQAVYDIILGRKKSSRGMEVNGFVKLIQVFDSYLKTTVSADSLARVLRSQKVAFGHHTFHTKIDHLLDDLNVPDSDSVREWKTKYEQDVKNISASVCGEGVHKSYIVTEQSIKSSKRDELSTQAVTLRGTGPASSNKEWFIHLSEIQYDRSDHFAAGGFGTIYRGVWLRGTQVVVKFIHNDKEVSDDWFLHEVNIWHRLQHPHVVRLWGACNVGRRYFVCEYASNGTLSGYLKNQQAKNLGAEKLRRLKWRLLHEAALGLEYVHGRNVIHNDLKCDNILIGDDGKAKLTDFGLSSMPIVAELTFQTNRMGAVHWKAPEYVKTGEPTFPSDIYSFAMCILEAITGEIPWGQNAVEGSVRRWLRKGQFPLRPEGFDDNEWNLIELMTRNEPEHRVGISFVIDRLQALGVDDPSATTEL